MKANRLFFANNLVHLRTKQGKSQKELAEELGIQEDRLRHWEAGTNYPKMTILVPLVNLLGFTDIYRLLTEDIRH
ncbi:helix-turn-helix transcriptional regulator [Paraflavitalea sp. CAU 1676]|uniref:helix-turn-helix domain-containing protein n=1 Tax=Paraflavitalea sp. CAU 1676 TaxID=3032598 RepID=UPI0023DA810D|nr:helix-turn-helix transcriptional regulator [Paraflavitalea sp. CAU 1676]MDF2189311.1 helix-turn-helix transcriptional regulator [Paraflavitalea sp. CAU 1676]